MLDRTTVQVLAVANFPKATLVTIDPHTEDDWEILELNSEYAEATILKQILKWYSMSSGDATILMFICLL